MTANHIHSKNVNNVEATKERDIVDKAPIEYGT